METPIEMKRLIHFDLRLKTPQRRPNPTRTPKPVIATLTNPSSSKQFRATRFQPPNRAMNNQPSHPFTRLDKDAFGIILSQHLSARDRVHLRATSSAFRSAVDEYEETRSISLYARWSETMEEFHLLARACGLRERGSLANALIQRGNRDCHFDVSLRHELAVEHAVLRISEFEGLAIPLPGSGSVREALVKLHHVQRLLSDGERKGLETDADLLAVRKRLRERLAGIPGVEEDLVWPRDAAAASVVRRR